MYFEAAGPDRPTVVKSAVSPDGLKWKPEPGVRAAAPGASFGSPRCVYVELPSDPAPLRSITSRVAHDAVHHPFDEPPERLETSIRPSPSRPSAVDRHYWPHPSGQFRLPGRSRPAKCAKCRDLDFFRALSKTLSSSRRLEKQPGQGSERMKLMLIAVAFILLGVAHVGAQGLHPSNESSIAYDPTGIWEGTSCLPDAEIAKAKVVLGREGWGLFVYDYISGFQMLVGEWEYYPLDNGYASWLSNQYGLFEGVIRWLHPYDGFIASSTKENWCMVFVRADEL